MRSLDESVNELLERGIELARRYAVWWELVNEQHQALNNGVVSAHVDFFQTTSQALFESFSVIAYQLYETRRDTIHISSIRDEPAATHAVATKRVSELIDECEPLRKKLSAIRANVYAHRNKLQTLEKIFERAGLLPEEMGRFVDLTAEIIGLLAEAAGVKTRNAVVDEITLRREYAAGDTVEVMRALRERGARNPLP